MSRSTPTATRFRWTGSAAAWRCARPRTRSRFSATPATWLSTPGSPTPRIGGSCWRSTGRRGARAANVPILIPKRKPSWRPRPRWEPLLAAVREAARYGLYDLDRLERMILRRVVRDYFLLDDGRAHV